MVVRSGSSHVTECVAGQTACDWARQLAAERQQRRRTRDWRQDAATGSSAAAIVVATPPRCHLNLITSCLRHELYPFANLRLAHVIAF